jgi:hypothetical protein
LLYSASQRRVHRVQHGLDEDAPQEHVRRLKRARALAEAEAEAPAPDDEPRSPSSNADEDSLGEDSSSDWEGAQFERQLAQEEESESEGEGEGAAVPPEQHHQIPWALRKFSSVDIIWPPSQGATDEAVALGCVLNLVQLQATKSLSSLALEAHVTLWQSLGLSWSKTLPSKAQTIRR